jgi:hypothetical protein
MNMICRLSVWQEMQKHKILNWTGRICGLLIIGFFLLFFVGEGVPDIVSGKGKGLLIFLPFALPALLGYIISWRHPVKGGWFMIVGALLMAGYLIYFNDARAGLIYGIPTAGVGLCFLAAGGKELL